jgi:hypothetical protein
MKMSTGAFVSLATSPIKNNIVKQESVNSESSVLPSSQMTPSPQATAPAQSASAGIVECELVRLR